MNNLLNYLGTNLVSLVALVGLVVLTAMNKIPATTAVPVITALAGVHIGSNLSGTTTVTMPTSAPSQQAAEIGGAK